MTEEAMKKALSAIHDEAEKLLTFVPSGGHELQRGLSLIMSLARYKHDIRPGEEINKKVSYD